MSSPTDTFLSRFQEAVGSHDADRVVANFATDCHFELPLHPARSFDGREQARTNWTMIFDAVPDLALRLVADVQQGNRLWAEWEYTGTRADGSAHHMRGVTIITVNDDAELASANFYVEFVDQEEVSITEHLASLNADS